MTYHGRGRAAAAGGGAGFAAAVIERALAGDYDAAWTILRPTAVAVLAAAAGVLVATFRSWWSSRIDTDGDGIIDAIDPDLATEVQIDGASSRRLSRLAWRLHR